MMSNYKKLAVSIVATVAVAAPTSAAVLSTTDDGAANGLRIVQKDKPVKAQKANGL